MHKSRVGDGMQLHRLGLQPVYTRPRLQDERGSSETQQKPFSSANDSAVHCTADAQEEKRMREV